MNVKYTWRIYGFLIIWYGMKKSDTETGEIWSWVETIE